MKRPALALRIPWKGLLGAFAMLALIAWSTGVFNEKVRPGVVDAPAGQPAPADLARLTVTAETAAVRLALTGTVESEHTVRIHAQVGGVVTGVYAAAGDRVAKDDRLLAIDQRILVEQRAAALARLHRATTENARMQRLLAAEAATTQQATAAETEETAARAEVDRLNVLLGFHAVTAPIAGRIADRLIEPGDLAAPGQPLFVLFDPGALRVTAAIPAALSDRIAVGDALPLTLDRPALSVTGTVTEILGTIDPATRTRTVRIALPLPPGPDTPVPGTFARVWLADAAAERLTIPATALFRVGQLEMVQVVNDDHRLIRRLVRTGPPEGDRVEILSGLRAGETIATTPLLDATP